jgi:hypothetical protein
MTLTMAFYAVAVNATWPFITFHDFEDMGYQAIKHTGANFVEYFPLVKHGDRQAYEEYMYEHQEWIQNGLAYRGTNDANILIARTPTSDAIGVVAVFVLTAMVFVVYDISVPRRQTSLLSSAEQTSAIVNSLFPENVRGILIGDALNKTQEASKKECIYTSQSELERFHHIIVNAVIATDIFNEERMITQAARWEDAFYSQPESSIDGQTSNKNWRAMAIVENMLAASDFLHAMQHWEVYVK